MMVELKPLWKIQSVIKHGQSYKRCNLFKKIQSICMLYEFQFYYRPGWPTRGSLPGFMPLLLNYRKSH